MARRGLNREGIILAAIDMVEEKGYRNFSMRELAATLGVQPASLYNHVSGIEEVNTAVGIYGVQRLEQALTDACQGQEFAQGMMGMAKAYRRFAEESPELYQALIEMRTSENEELRKAVHGIIRPFLGVISGRVKDRTKAIHLQRFVRSTLHGFVSLEQEGYLTYGSPDMNESFQYMVGKMIAMIESEGEKN